MRTLWLKIRERWAARRLMRASGDAVVTAHPTRQALNLGESRRVLAAALPAPGAAPPGFDLSGGRRLIANSFGRG